MAHIRRSSKLRAADDTPTSEANSWEGERGYKVTWKSGMFSQRQQRRQRSSASVLFISPETGVKASFDHYFWRRFSAKQLADAQLAPQGREGGSRKISGKAAGWKVANNVFFHPALSFTSGYFRAGERGRRSLIQTHESQVQIQVLQ